MEKQNLFERSGVLGFGQIYDEILRNFSLLVYMHVPIIYTFYLFFLL